MRISDWSSDVCSSDLLVEADLSGGVLAVRYGLGREPGLTSLAAANPTEEGGWLDHAQDAGGVPVLVGPDSPEAAEALWRTAGERIVTVLDRSEGWAVIDAGRVWRRPPIVDAAEDRKSTRLTPVTNAHLVCR